MITLGIKFPKVSIVEFDKVSTYSKGMLLPNSMMKIWNMSVDSKWIDQK